MSTVAQAVAVWTPQINIETKATASSDDLQEAPLYTGGENNRYILARHTFTTTLSRPVAIRCCANDLYELWVDGQFTGRGPSPSDTSTGYVDAWIIDLPPGRHVLAFVAYCQGENSGHPQFQTLIGPGGLWFEAEQEGSLLAVSGQDTRVMVAPHFSQGTDRLQTTVWGYQEVWNQSLEPDRWRQEPFDDSDWTVATKARWQPDRFVDSETPALRYAELAAPKVLSLQSLLGSVEGWKESALGDLLVTADVPYSKPTITIDFGMTVVGRLRILGEGSGGFMTISYGETLETERCDTVVPNGKFEWSSFSRRAFRFVTVEFFQFKKLTISYLGALSVTTSIESTGSFACSDSELDQIWQLGNYTLETATQHYVEADAWRERAIWFNAVEQRVAAVTTGDFRVIEQTLRMMGEIATEEGAVPATGPVRNSTILPDYPHFWVRGVVDSVRFSGNLDFGLEMFPVVQRQLEFYRNSLNQAGLVDRGENSWWIHIDWSRLDRDAVMAILNFRFIEALADAAWLAAALGKSTQHRDWTCEREQLIETVHKAFFDHERAMYADALHSAERGEHAKGAWFSQQTNAIAVLAGLSSGDEARALLRRVTNPDLLPSKERSFLVLNDVFGGWYSTVVDQTGYGEPRGAGYTAKIGYCQTPFSAGWLAESLFESDSAWV